MIPCQACGERTVAATVLELVGILPAGGGLFCPVLACLRDCMWCRRRQLSITIGRAVR